MSDRARSKTPTYAEGLADETPAESVRAREYRRSSSVSKLARQVLEEGAEKGTDEAQLLAMESVLSLWRADIAAKVRDQLQREHAKELRELRAQVSGLTEQLADRDRIIREMRGGR